MENVTSPGGQLALGSRDVVSARSVLHVGAGERLSWCLSEVQWKPRLGLTGTRAVLLRPTPKLPGAGGLLIAPLDALQLAASRHRCTALPAVGRGILTVTSSARRRVWEWCLALSLPGGPSDPRLGGAHEGQDLWGGKVPAAKLRRRSSDSQGKSWLRCWSPRRGAQSLTPTRPAAPSTLTARGCRSPSSAGGVDGAGCTGASIHPGGEKNSSAGRREE